MLMDVPAYQAQPFVFTNCYSVKTKETEMQIKSAVQPLKSLYAEKHGVVHELKNTKWENVSQG